MRFNEPFSFPHDLLPGFAAVSSRFAGSAARSDTLAENKTLSLRDLSRIAISSAQGRKKKTASPASVDKYVKYVHKKKKLHVSLGVVATRSNHGAPNPAVCREAANGGDLGALQGPHATPRPGGKKISLVFLSQGLRSDETSKMRSLPKRFGVSLHMVPLRLWSNSKLSDSPSLFSRRSRLYGEILLLSSSHPSSDSDRSPLGSECIYSIYEQVVNYCIRLRRSSLSAGDDSTSSDAARQRANALASLDVAGRGSEIGHKLDPFPFSHFSTAEIEMFEFASKGVFAENPASRLILPRDVLALQGFELPRHPHPSDGASASASRE
jgi:hypothetical protein